MKSILAFCVILGLALSHVSGNCSGNCPDTEDVVWALNGNCVVFRNKCFFDKENCHRKPALRQVSKEECQNYCATVCPQVYQPVSGTYKGQIRNFGNSCEKAVHSCLTGETFLD